jgi:TorA maturation chaperone TorD
MHSALPASASTGAEAAPAGGTGLLPLADLYLSLAAAFLPPPMSVSCAAWCATLAADLADLGTATGIEASAAAEALQRLGTSDLDEADEAWLVRYSRLFLVPPVGVTLNTGIYLDGALGGQSVRMMEECYASAGFARSERFRDLPDHVAVQFEFLGALLERAELGDQGAAELAAEFAITFVAHWIEPLRTACERAVTRDSAASVYAALADLARRSLAALA